MLSSAALATIGLLTGLKISYLGPEEKEGCKWYAVQDATDRYHLKRCFDPNRNGVFKMPRVAQYGEAMFAQCLTHADAACLASGTPSLPAPVLAPVKK